MQQQAIQVFEDLFLESNPVSQTVARGATSPALVVTGNKVTVATRVINSANLLTSTNTALTVVVQGSIDGNAWVNVLTQTLTGDDLASGSPEYEQDLTDSNWSYPFARVYVDLPNNNTDTASMLLSVSLGFSDQGS